MSNNKILALACALWYPSIHPAREFKLKYNSKGINQDYLINIHPIAYFEWRKNDPVIVRTSHGGIPCFFTCYAFTIPKPPDGIFPSNCMAVKLLGKWWFISIFYGTTKWYYKSNHYFNVYCFYSVRLPKKI